MNQAIRDEIAKATYDVKFVEHGMDLRDGEEIADIVAPIIDRILDEQRVAIARAIADYGRQWHNEPSAHGAAKAATAYWCATIAKDYGKTHHGGQP
jgi:hypothetical protein